MHTITSYRHAHRRETGLTLVETLVGVLLVALLASMLTAGMSRVSKNLRKTREISAARNVISAYLSAASDRDGEFLPGMDYRVKEITLPSGKKLNGHTCQRFPYRLGEYLGYNLDGALVLKENGKQIEKTSPRGSGFYEYMVSAFPAFGMNVDLVGGTVDGNGYQAYGEETLTRPQQTQSSLLVFASAGGQLGTTRMDGFNILSPPRLKVENWTMSQWTEKTNPGVYGSVDARHDGFAVCAFTDGSVQMKSIEELRDMRLWSKSAAAQGDPNYLIPQ